jgi:hypothetical protein
VAHPQNINRSPHVQSKIKRKRGGQPGNQNARKRGFYSRRLTPDQLSELAEIVNTERLDPEIATLRVKLVSILQDDPPDYRALREVVKRLTDWYTAEHRLNKTDSRYLKMFIWRVIESYLPPGDGDKNK